MFLTNKKKMAYYLLIMDDQKRLDMNKLKEITKESRMSFHPNVNTKTIFLDTNDIFKFLDNIDYNYSIIDI